MRKPLEEVQVNIVPNPKPNGKSMESKFNYFLILCNSYSKTFRTIGTRDKTSEAYIDGIEQMLTKFSTFRKNKEK